MKAATTVSCLEAEQDNGGGPRCQEAMGDTIAKTRFEIVSKLSNGSMLARGEDASKQGRNIDDIDVDKETTLVNDQDNAKLFYVNDLHGEEVVKDINTTKLIVDDAQVNAAGKVNDASIATTVSAAAIITTKESTLAKALVEIKTSKPKAKGIVLQKPTKEQQELIDKENATLFMQLLEKRTKFFAAKRAEEKRNKPPTQAQQRKIICTYLKNMEGKKLMDLKNKSFDSIQKMFDKPFKRVNTFVDFKAELVKGSSKRAREELKQARSKKQKVDDDNKTTEHKKIMEIILNEEEVVIDAIPFVVKFPKIVDWKIHKEGKKRYYQIIRADGNSKMYMVFNRMLKEFDKKDLEDM
nr:hypothetical protein [Tanacetum cinerariifolium]